MNSSATWGQLAVYQAFVRNAFLNMLAYRLRYFTGIVTYLLFVTVHYFIWNAVFSNMGPDSGRGAEINGFTLSEMVTYVSIGWIARSLYFSNIDSEINELVRTGQISVYLLRPVNFHVMMLTQAAGESLFRMLFFTVPISLVILTVYPVSPPAGAIGLLFFLLSTVFSFLILAQINFIVGMFAFYVKSIDGISRAKYFLVQLFSGLMLPMTFFPEWARVIADALPFSAIAYLPLRLYLGKVPIDQVPLVFGTQAAWFLLLFILSHLLWLRAVRFLTLQGG